VKILFSSETEKAEFWLPLLQQALPEDAFTTDPQEKVDVALIATPPRGLLAKLDGVKLIQSLWMGVDRLLDDPGLPKGVPLARLIDPGMVAGMTETVLAHVLDWHKHHYRYRAQQAERQWRRRKQYLAADRTIGILGLGELGADAARRLLDLGFRVAGYSRRRKSLAGVQSFTELEPMLRLTDALVCLLPLTHLTRGILNRATFGKLARDGKLGAPVIINAGRGGLQVEDDILACLDDGTLAAATLDVFHAEPLPADSPFWTHPKVTLSPHNAADTDPDAISVYVAEQIAAFERGERLVNVVDRGVGY